MGVRNLTVGFSNLNFTTVTTTSETIIATLPPISESVDNAPIILFWYFKMVLGTATTGLTSIIRRGTTLTGTILANQFQDQGGISAVEITRSQIWIDNPGVVAGQQYVLTVQQAAATGNGQVHEVTFLGVVL